MPSSSSALLTPEQVSVWVEAVRFPPPIDVRQYRAMRASGQIQPAELEAARSGFKIARKSVGSKPASKARPNQADDCSNNQTKSDVANALTRPSHEDVKTSQNVGGVT